MVEPHAVPRDGNDLYAALINAHVPPQRADAILTQHNLTRCYFGEFSDVDVMDLQETVPWPRNRI